MTEMPIDLLILELAMIENNGSSFISELKKKQPNVRIIVLSNYGEPHLVREAFIQRSRWICIKDPIIHLSWLSVLIRFWKAKLTWQKASGWRLQLDKNKKHASFLKKRE
jgi:DNA-binding NtrC family response regulator